MVHLLVNSLKAPARPAQWAFSALPEAWAAFAALAALSILACPLATIDAASVEYELRAGSVINDGCKDCDRIPIERPLRGSFSLAPRPVLPGAESYDLLDLDAASDDGVYVVKGSGVFSILVTATPTQQLTLDVGINGVDGIALSSGPVDLIAPFPAIDIQVTEPGDRDPAHLYTIRIVAAPKVPKVLYQLQEGSTFTDDCLPCAKPTIPVPIVGTFLLGEIAGGASPFFAYVVDDVDFQSDREGVDYKIVGGGIYKQGGEVALVQEMRLELTVNDSPGNILASKDPQVPVKFPAIEIDLLHENPATEFHVYSLHIVAKPAETAPRFRRADENADGAVDISDAVSTLNWLFLGGASPTCLEAADSNGDGTHDLSDAVYTLLFLFQGGGPPPAPGPVDCGSVPEPSAGCESYPAC